MPYRDDDGFLALVMRVSVNGQEVGQDLLSNTGWPFEDLVSYASRGTWVRAGDVLGSDTCGNGGCLAELWGRRGEQILPPLRPGDVVEMSVEGIGTLRNRVVEGVELPPVRPARPRAEPGADRARAVFMVGPRFVQSRREGTGRRDTPSMVERSGGESVLYRAVRILETLTPDEPALTVSETARRSGLNVATASRLIATLVGHGLLARRGDGLVVVGTRLWGLALRASPARGLRDAAVVTGCRSPV